MNNRSSMIFSLLSALILFISSNSVIAADTKKAALKKKTVPPVSDTSYKIGAGDVLRITTWKEPDFTLDEVLVRMDGKITFPLLDDIQAAGMTTIQVKRDIEAKLKKYVGTPVVTVSVGETNSKRFYVLGEVRNTGEYPLQKNLTVLQAFALAGGFTEWASKDEIIVLRREDGLDKVIRVNYKKIAKGKDLSNNISIQPDDTIIVP